MREIKFRAWNTLTLVMLDLRKMTPIMLNMDTDGLFIPFSDGLFLMQYTGLKDKNGKEIYEGDIVRYQDHEWKVVWSEILAGFHLKGAGGMVYDFEHRRNFNESIAPECEIIGNIYENPELMEGKS